MDEIGSLADTIAKKIIRRRPGEEDLLLISPGKIGLSVIKPEVVIDAENWSASEMVMERGHSAIDEVRHIHSIIRKPVNKSGFPRLDQKGGRSKKGVQYPKERIEMENLLARLKSHPRQVQQNLGKGVVIWPELSTKHGYPLEMIREDYARAFTDLSGGVRGFTGSTANKSINDAVDRLAPYKICKWENRKLIFDLEERKKYPIEELIQVAIGAKKPTISVKAHTKEESKSKGISVSRRSLRQQSIPDSKNDYVVKTFTAKAIFTDIVEIHKRSWKSTISLLKCYIISTIHKTAQFMLKM